MKSNIYVFALFLLFGTLTAAYAQPASLVNITAYKGHTYGLIAEGSTWTEAKVFAETLGGHLVTIGDEAESNFLFNTFVVSQTSWTGHWIGLYCPDDNILNLQSWQWINGEPVSFMNFRSNQPDPSMYPPAFGVDKYGAIGFEYSSGWDNYFDTFGHVYGAVTGIVEIDTVPEVWLINNLTAAVFALNLQNGIANSLDAKLDAAIAAIDDIHGGNDQAAIGSLNAFVNQVNAQRGNRISESDADMLIAKAQEILAILLSQ